MLHIIFEECCLRKIFVFSCCLHLNKMAPLGDHQSCSCKCHAAFSIVHPSLILRQKVYNTWTFLFIYNIYTKSWNTSKHIKIYLYRRHPWSPVLQSVPSKNDFIQNKVAFYYLHETYLENSIMYIWTRLNRHPNRLHDTLPRTGHTVCIDIVSSVLSLISGSLHLRDQLTPVVS